MKASITIDRWIDIDGAEFKQVEDHAHTYRFTLRSIEVGAVTPDKNGHLYSGTNPIHIDLDGKKVGLRYSVKASN